MDITGLIVGAAAGAGVTAGICAAVYSIKKKSVLKILKEIAIEIDAKDPYFGGHSRRVAEYAVKLGRKVKLGSGKLFRLEAAAYFTEIGKLRIPEEILRKREKLTNEEFEIVKKHPIIGFKMLEEIKGMEDVAKIVKSHHERVDGAGYPDGLKGETIPIESKIINIVDSFDAMVSTRPYRKTMSENEAVEELRKGKGKQFEPELVDHFIDVLMRS